MSKFMFEYDIFVHSIRFRYTIIEFIEQGIKQYAVGVAIVFEDEGFQMLQGEIFDNLNDAKLCLVQMSLSKNEIDQDSIFLSKLLAI
ncbi:hypothetical protein [Bacillus cereus]|uniref:hypothetical protein n=1 Tax=Bacillus cereus TaxID=1396 RepID=UPI001F29AD60|nr:hypothetical protein [Bacillus cereus]BCB35592.1 hypothetical protein BCM0045_0487 [Bacillus cereus]BCB98401.1 hypothetical protein BCM0057_0484 [Bacillus cereus]BCC21894.1 hypothetical protein BCM0079_0487 [Bacillus cereus]BCC33505.1 hypothetical protein BCM0105_0495 [Bacillus cereus]